MHQQHERLEHLFKQLQELTGVQDIAYHQIKEGRLCPVLKTNTDMLGVERWKSVHAQNPVYIERDRLLRDLVQLPRPLTVQEVKNDPRSSEEFFLFGIDSILIVPVLENEVVQGIVVVASIGQLHSFSDSEILQAERLVGNDRRVFQV